MIEIFTVGVELLYWVLQRCLSLELTVK